MGNEQGQHRGPRGYVLIVDDDAEDVAVLESYLREEGEEVESVLTELEAREKLTVDPPAILIIDVCAPSMDGVGLLRLFWESSAQDGASIVACSERKPLAPGALRGISMDVHLHKPWAEEKAQVYLFIRRIFDQYGRPA